MKFNLGNVLAFSVLLLTVASIHPVSDLPIGNTYIWWSLYAFILILFLKSKSVYFDLNNLKKIRIIQLYLAWNIICIIRGFFVAENYWELKNLVITGFVLLLPLSIYISTNTIIIQKILSKWIAYALPAFLLFLPFFVNGDASGRYLVPLSFLLLFIPFVPTKWKLIIISLTLFVILIDLDARSNVIKYSASLLLSLTYYFRNLLTKKFFIICRLLLLIIPIILFGLALSGVFNIFKMDEYINGEYTTQVNVNGELKEANLTSDTRTFLYKEVLLSAFNNEYVLFGRTPARGNDSEAFGLFAFEELNTGKMERFGNEVSILNIFTWTGLVGVILYFFIFYRASYLAIYKSNSIVMKILGVYVTFRWVYAWVEDFSNFDLSYLFLWIIIGMCFSSSFRSKTTLEIKYWVLGIFEKRHRKEGFKRAVLF